MVDPAWFEAAGTDALAALSAVSMIKKKSAEEAAATAAPTPVSVTVNGITGPQYLFGMFLLAGAMLVLAAAMLASAAVIHHGLTA